jgi:glycosyltransferase involved in cell wall biosynthesis
VIQVAPRVSLLVTTYTVERAGDILDLLDSAMRQRSDQIEVILVAEGSPQLQATVERVAESFNGLRIKVVPNAGVTGLSGARNAGITYAQGDIVAFVDDDVVLFPDWCERLLETFARHESVVGVMGTAIPLWEDPRMTWLPEEFFWIVSCTGSVDGEQEKPVRNAWGVNMAFRRKVFDCLRFDERLGGNMGSIDGSKLGLLGEDTLFSVRVREATGGTILCNPRVKVYHKVRGYRLTRRYFTRRAFWEGFTKATLVREYGPRLGLERERQLLEDILVRFFPKSVRDLVRQPVLSAKRMSFATTVLFLVALGYASAMYRPLAKLTVPSFSR